MALENHLTTGSLIVVYGRDILLSHQRLRLPSVIPQINENGVVVNLLWL
jgi:hypothetical protein